MDKDENTTSETLSGEVDVASLDGEEAVDDMTDDFDESSEETADALSLEELNEHLGKKFKTKDAALKALKDTFKYVGKAGQVEKELQNIKSKSSKNDGKYITREEYETEMFYKDHPEYSEMRGTIDRIAKADGVSPREVVEQDDFKSLYEKVVGYDESQKAKSVLESNPRIGQATNKVKQSRDALEKGDAEVAKGTALDAVMETMADDK